MHDGVRVTYSKCDVNESMEVNKTEKSARDEKIQTKSHIVIAMAVKESRCLEMFDVSNFCFSMPICFFLLYIQDMLDRMHFVREFVIETQQQNHREREGCITYQNNA